MDRNLRIIADDGALRKGPTVWPGRAPRMMAGDSPFTTFGLTPEFAFDFGKPITPVAVGPSPIPE